MSNTKFFNDPVTVKATFDADGQVTPTWLTWRNEDVRIVSVGRQWETPEGRHVLVEAATGTRYELQLSKSDLIWRLKQNWANQLAA